MCSSDLKYGYTFWYVIMAAFGVMGGISMFMVMRKQKRLHHEAS